MLSETAKATNVVGSIQQYFEDHIALVLNSSAPAIDYGGGMPFRDEAQREWLQVRTLIARSETGQAPFAGRVAGADADARAAEIQWILVVNCFVRPGKFALNTYYNLRPYQLRDVVLGIVREGTRIPVKDYIDATSQGHETIGYLFVSEILADRPIEDPARTELVQHNLMFSLRWTETWNP